MSNVIRTRSLVCLSLLALAGLCRAQGDAILESRVDKLLRQWADRTSQIKSLYTEFSQSTKDAVWQKDTQANGSARYLAPDRARLDIMGDNAQSLVVTGKREIWHYKVEDKQITVYHLNEDVDPQAALEDGPLPFLFATKPERAKQRYTFEILEEDDNIIKTKIVPKLEEDKSNFTYAIVTLDKENLLPKQLFFEEVNQNTVTYDFVKIWTNIDIKLTDFDPVQPEGWKRIDKEPGEEEVAGQGGAGGRRMTPRQGGAAMPESLQRQR